MATKTNRSEHTVLSRLERIENKLFGNGESLIERVARLEEGQRIILRRIEEYHENRQKDMEQAILKAHERTNELLNTQVTQQIRQNKMQLIGLWITIASLVGGFLASKALGWIK